VHIPHGDPEERGHTLAATLCLPKCPRAGYSANNKDTLWHACWGLGGCQRAGGDLNGAVVSLQLSLDMVAARPQVLRTDEGQVTFLESRPDVFDQLMAVHLERARADASGAQHALVVAALRTIFAQSQRDAAGQQPAVVVNAMELRRPKATQL